MISSTFNSRKVKISLPFVKLFSFRPRQFHFIRIPHSKRRESVDTTQKKEGGGKSFSKGSTTRSSYHFHCHTATRRIEKLFVLIFRTISASIQLGLRSFCYRKVLALLAEKLLKREGIGAPKKDPTTSLFNQYQDSSISWLSGLFQKIICQATRKLTISSDQFL